MIDVEVDVVTFSYELLRDARVAANMKEVELRLKET
jgi:hypothetical protein